MAVKQRLDTPTNNFATLNPLFINGTETTNATSSLSLSEGNLKLTADSNYSLANGTFTMRTGKWYWETYINTSVNFPMTGITHGTSTAENSYVGYDPNGNVKGISYSGDGTFYGDSNGDGTHAANNTATGLSTYTTGDIIGCFFDADIGSLKFFKNGTLIRTESGINRHDWHPATSAYNSGINTVNFGQDATFVGNKTPTKVYTDARGLGRFYYQPPEGALALCTANLGASSYKSAPTSYVSDETNTKILTYNGNVEQVPYSPYATDGYSLHGIATTGLSFGSVSDFKYLHDNTDQSYSISCWVYRTVGDVAQALVDTCNFTSEGYGVSFSIEANNKVFFQINKGSGGNAVAATGSNETLPLNKWTHISVLHNGTITSGNNVVSMYINGVEVTYSTRTYDHTNSSNNSSTSLHVGIRSGANLGFTGYIADLAIMKNVTSSNFVAQSSKITSSTHADIDFLLSVDSIGFKDSSSSPKTVTTVGAPSIEAWSPYTTDAIEFGTEYRTPETAHEIGSFSFDSGKNLTVNNINIGASDYYIELWVYLDSSGVNYHHIIDSRSSGDTDTSAILLGVQTSNMKFYMNSGSDSETLDTTIAKDKQWHHVALYRANSNFNVYIDGVKQTFSGSDVQSAYVAKNLSNTTFHIGKQYDSTTTNHFKGLISDLIIGGTLSETKYAGNSYNPTSIAVPVTELPTLSTHHLHLQPYKSYNANNLLTSNFSYNKDSSPIPKSLTYVGNTKIVDESPYKSGANGSFSFDGVSGGNVKAQELGSDFTLGTGSYTIEMWMFSSSGTTGRQPLITHRYTTSGSNTVEWSWFVNGDSFEVHVPGSTIVSGDSCFGGDSTGNWFHVAWCREGTGTNQSSFYVNGARVINHTLGSSYDWSTGGDLSIGYDGDPANTFVGEITDVRVVKGQALYSGDSFIPPAFPLRADKYSIDGSDPSGGSNITGTVSLLAQPGALASNDPAKKPFEHFKPVKYVGTEADGNTVTGVGFKSDLIWIKDRDSSSQHVWIDSVRGHNKEIFSSLTNAETTDANRGGSYKSALSVINTDGFVLNSNVGPTGSTNAVNKKHIAWCWKAGGSTPSKTYYVKVSGGKYQFFGDVSNSGGPANAPTLSLQEGGTYTFDQSDSSNGLSNTHPLRFATAADAAGSTQYTTNVSYSGTPGTDGAYVRITVAASAPTLYYYCTNHSGMGGQINTTTTHGQTEFGGSIIPIVSANKEAGFSIAKYTGTNVSSTMGHGLSKAPEVILLKNLDSADQWVVYHKSVASDAETDYLVLNTTAAAVDATIWNDTAPTNQVFSIGTGGSVSEPSENFIAYCWHSVPGYSSIGSYEGNANADGPFIYTGFRPAWFMVKNADDGTTSSGPSWDIYDSAREPNNDGAFNSLSANSSGTEGHRPLDFLSNGIKIREPSSWNLNAANTYIYIAFAEAPVNFSNAR